MAEAPLDSSGGAFWPTALLTQLDEVGRQASRSLGGLRRPALVAECFEAGGRIRAMENARAGTLRKPSRASLGKNRGSARNPGRSAGGPVAGGGGRRGTSSVLAGERTGRGRTPVRRVPARACPRSWSPTSARSGIGGDNGSPRWFRWSLLYAQPALSWPRSGASHARVRPGGRAGRACRGAAGAG